LRCLKSTKQSSISITDLTPKERKISSSQSKVTNSSNQEYKLVRIEDGNLDAAKEAFLRSFHYQYKQYDPVKDLGLEPIEGTPSNDKAKDDRQILELFLQIAFS